MGIIQNSPTMAKLAPELISVTAASSSTSSLGLQQRYRVSRIRACQPTNGKKNLYKQLGLFPLSLFLNSYSQRQMNAGSLPLIIFFFCLERQTYVYI